MLRNSRDGEKILTAVKQLQKAAEHLKESEEDMSEVLQRLRAALTAAKERVAALSADQSAKTEIEQLVATRAALEKEAEQCIEDTDHLRGEWEALETTAREAESLETEVDMLTAGEIPQRVASVQVAAAATHITFSADGRCAYIADERNGDVATVRLDRQPSIEESDLLWDKVTECTIKNEEW